MNCESSQCYIESSIVILLLLCFECSSMLGKMYLSAVDTIHDTIHDTRYDTRLHDTIDDTNG